MGVRRLCEDSERLWFDNPGSDYGDEVAESHFFRMQFASRQDTGQILTKLVELRRDPSSAGNRPRSGLDSEPCGHSFNGAGRVAAMGPYILARYVRHEALISILFRIKDQRALALLLLIAKSLCADEKPEFQRHVEPGQRRIAVRFCTRQIMDAETALFDDALDFGESVFGSVIRLQGASCPKTGTNDRKHYRVENRLELRVKGAIYEDVPRKRPRH